MGQVSRRHHQPSCDPVGGHLQQQGERIDECSAVVTTGERQADLQHALHVAALPVMYLKAYEDTDNEIALSANSAILLPENGEVGYAEPASSAFDSQQAFITELENQMRNLGISTLFSQTYVGETAEAKAMDRRIAIPCFRSSLKI